MPGLISDIFAPDTESRSDEVTTIDGHGETGVEASPSISIEVSGSHDDADGSTSQWSNSTEIGGDINVDAAIAGITMLADNGTLSHG